MSHGFVELNSKIAYTFFAFTNRKKNITHSKNKHTKP